MSYELKLDESAAKGARRILRHQVESALELLSGPAAADQNEAVHEARKHFKKVRGALRLWRGALGPKDYRRENTCFRDAGRPLTEVRDAAVLIETLDELARGYPDEVPKAEIDRARRELKRLEKETRSRVLVEGQAFTHVSEILREALPRLDDLPVQAKGWAALRDGLRDVYRTARCAFADARADPTVENLHEWRKQVKYLWHQLQILRPVAPTSLDERAEHAHQLGELLGKDHDLAVLHQTVSGLPQAARDLDALGQLLRLIDRRRAELQKAAFGLGERVHGDRPAPFVGEVRRHFRRWRREARLLGVR
jgi:CHAD domain-containing protein